MATETAKQIWFQKHTPEMAEHWQRFHDTVYETGELDRKTKELIAAAASTTLRCVHCTRGHIDAAQQYGADRREISEAIMMAGLLASGTQLHWMLDDYQKLLSENGDGQSPWFIQQTGQMGQQWKDFYDAVYAESALDRKTKELLAVALGSIGRCRHCTAKHISLAQEHGASKAEISEALMVAALIASGTQLVWMLEDYERLLG